MSARPSDPGARLVGAAPVFAALGDGVRLELVARLSSEGPLSVTRLGAGLAVTRQAVSKHLQALAGAGLVRAERQGRERVYALEPRRVEDACRALDRISAEWDQSLARLRALVEGPPGRLRGPRRA